MLKKNHFHIHLIKLIKKKKGKALDLACGAGYYSRFLSNHDWSVDAVDLKNPIVLFKGLET